MATDNLAVFFTVIGSFPTVLFSVFLGVCLLYWLLAMFGLFDWHLGDFGHSHNGAEGEGLAGSFAGMLAKFGLNGVPVTLVLTCMAVFSWLLSFYGVYWLDAVLQPLGWLRQGIYALLVPVFLYAATWCTAWVIRPLRPFFLRINQADNKVLTGRVAQVRSLRVDNQFGEAELTDSSANLIVKVRSIGDSRFARGDKVVLLQYHPQEFYYSVVSEAEFTSGHKPL
jgi:hypothetical protein